MKYQITLGIAEKVIENLSSPFFFSNSKTVVSVDFSVCSLMKKDKRGLYGSKVCKGCYAVNLLNVYPALRNKLENLPNPLDFGQLELFEDSLKTLKEYLPVLTRLRFYALSDFDKSHVDYIRIAANYFEVDIISKALCFPQNEVYLKELIEVENVWISLSFNKDFMKYFKRISSIASDADRVTLNYTLNYEEENPDDLAFKHLISVWHLKNDRKRYIIDQNAYGILSETNVCGVFTGDGQRTSWETVETKGGKRIKESKGSCHSCNLCRHSLKDKLSGIEASLPDALTVYK